MLEYIWDALKCFRSCFSRKTPWILFCMVVLSFIGTSELIEVTSFCRFWGGDKSLYMALLHFFRAAVWSLPDILNQWAIFVLAQNITLFIDGRAVLIGDYTYVPKDGRRIPGVVSLHQNSETQSKPSYFRGHCWGNFGLGGRFCAYPLLPSVDPDYSSRKDPHWSSPTP